jgi:hypothetical protein
MEKGSGLSGQGDYGLCCQVRAKGCVSASVLACAVMLLLVAAVVVWVSN